MHLSDKEKWLGWISFDQDLFFFKLYSLSLSRKNDTIILKKKEKGAISVNLNLG